MMTEPNSGRRLVDGFDACVALTGAVAEEHPAAPARRDVGWVEPVRAVRATGVLSVAVTPCRPQGIER